MDPLHEELLGALRARLAVVADHALRDRDPAAHLEALKAVAARLDRASAALRGRLDPRLDHFLKNQSFVKAVGWLEGERG